MKNYYLDLFAGIGGFSLGAYYAGMRFDEHYFSEIDDYAISVYQKRFPDAISLGDIKRVKGEALPEGNWIITGGFPCQDISVAGKGAGLEGSRSGLWFEYARIIGEIRPRFAVMENVGALTIRGLDRVLGSLAEIGYNAEWLDLRASDVGAPHKRERIWIVAYPTGELRERCRDSRAGGLGSTNDGKAMAYPDSQRLEGLEWGGAEKSAFPYFGGCSTLAYAKNNRSWQRNGELSKDQLFCESGADNRRRTRIDAIRQWWEVEPGVGRVANGVSRRVDRLRGLGNSIIPQIAMLIFMAIKPYFYYV